MSHEFHVYRLMRAVSSIHDFDPAIVVPITQDVQSLMAAITDLAPEIQWRDHPLLAIGRLAIQGGDTLEFRIITMAHDPAVTVIIESYRGMRELCYPVVERICKSLGWTAVDTTNWRILGANVAGDALA